MDGTIEILELLAGEIIRIRIKRLEHPLNGPLHQLPVVDRLNVMPKYLRPDINDGVEDFVRVPRRPPRILRDGRRLRKAADDDADGDANDGQRNTAYEF